MRACLRLGGYPGSYRQAGRGFAGVTALNGGSTLHDTHRLVGSVVTGVALADFITQASTIEICTANATCDDFWRLGAGDCREGSWVTHFGGRHEEAPAH